MEEKASFNDPTIREERVKIANDHSFEDERIASSVTSKKVEYDLSSVLHKRTNVTHLNEGGFASFNMWGVKSNMGKVNPEKYGSDMASSDVESSVDELREQRRRERYETDRVKKIVQEIPPPNTFDDLIKTALTIANRKEAIRKIAWLFLIYFLYSLAFMCVILIVVYLLLAALYRVEISTFLSPTNSLSFQDNLLNLNDEVVSIHSSEGTPFQLTNSHDSEMNIEFKATGTAVDQKIFFLDSNSDEKASILSSSSNDMYLSSASDIYLDPSGGHAFITADGTATLSVNSDTYNADAVLYVNGASILGTNSDDNVSIAGSTSVAEDLSVGGNATVDGTLVASVIDMTNATLYFNERVYPGNRINNISVGDLIVDNVYFESMYLDLTAATTFTGDVACSSGLSITNGGLKVTKGLTINSNGLWVSGGLTMYNSGEIHGGLSIIDGGLTVSSGGVIANAGLFVINNGIKVTHGITINNDGLHVSTGGITINNGGFYVTGGATIQNAGIWMRGGLTVFDTGISVNTGGIYVAGGASISSGGLKVVGGLSVTSQSLSVSSSALVGGGLTVTNGVTIETRGMWVTTGGITVELDGLIVTGGVTVLDTGLYVNGGGATINSDGLIINAAGAIINAGGCTINQDGMRIFGGLSVSDTGVSVNSGLTVLDTGLFIQAGGIQVQAGGIQVTNGISVSSAGVRVTGGLTVSNMGLSVTAGGLTVTSGNVILTNGNLELTNGNLAVDTGITTLAGLTVNDDGIYVLGGGMTINQDGLYVIGGVSTDTLTVTSNSGTSLYAVNAEFSGTVTANSVVTPGGTLRRSDARLKTNIQPITDALNKILLLNGVMYSWNAEKMKGLSPELINLRYLGFLAQEVQRVVPEIVSLDSDGKDEHRYLSVRYDEVIPIIVEGMKEFNAKLMTQQKASEGCENVSSKVLELEKEVKMLADELQELKEQYKYVLARINT
jgi:hypothetical protein